MSTALNRNFLRHYAEMVVVMFLGMAVLGLPAGWALQALGSSWADLQDQAPAAMLLLMAATMTLPMVGWMRRRGHGWGPTNEMSASMIVPTLAVIALGGAGLMSDVGTMLVVEHVLMLAGMLAVMLMRPEEYSHHHQHAAMA
jgi:hypothetical protein